MKEDILFKEDSLHDAKNLNFLLMNGFIIVSINLNSKTSTNDYHLRRTPLTWFMSKLSN